MPNEAKDYEAIAVECIASIPQQIIIGDGTDGPTQVEKIAAILRAHFPPQPDSTQGEERKRELARRAAEIEEGYEGSITAGDMSRPWTPALRLIDIYAEALRRIAAKAKMIPHGCRLQSDKAYRECAKIAEVALSSEPAPSAPSEPSGEEPLDVLEQYIKSWGSPDGDRGYTYHTEAYLKAKDALAALRSRAPQPEPGQDAGKR